jgi:hypothetical protein
MDYKTKYLKYKNKYLLLKNQIGGVIESLKESCKTQIKTNPYHSCPACYYKHQHIIKNEGDEHYDIYNTYRTTFPNKTLSVCTDMRGVEKYFIPDPSYNLSIWNGENFTDISYVSENILNTENYEGIKSYSVNASNHYTISLHDGDIHTFCAEGNIVWVSQNSKVGSTNIDTCMFVVIILNNGSKVCIHHHLQDEQNDDNPEYFTTEGQIFKNFYENHPENIITILNNSGISNENIIKIYLITEHLSAYDKYTRIYYELVDGNPDMDKFVNIDGQSLDIIVDASNNILKIARKS